MNITLVTTTSFSAPHFCCHPRLCNNLQADHLYHSLTEIKRCSSSRLSMADFRQQQLRPGGQATAGILPGKGNPSTSQVLAAVTLLPVGCTLLFLAGLNLVGTLTGLAVATPLFVVFSPVLVFSTLVIGLGVLGFLTSAAFGVTALSSFSWMVNYIRSLIGGSCHGNWIEQNEGHRKWQEK